MALIARAGASAQGVSDEAGQPAGHRASVEGRPPCVGGGCEPRDVSGIGLLAGPFNGAGYKPGPAPSVEDVLEQGLRQAAASPVHLAVRGVVRTSAQREAAVRFWLELDDAAILPSAAETERRFMAELDRMKAAYPATVRSNFQAIGWGGPADAGPRTPAPGIRRARNCVGSQAIWGFQGVPFWSMALRTVSSLCIHAVSATFGGLPAFTSRS